MQLLLDKLKAWGLDIAMVVLFAVLSFFYFQTPVSQGLVLGGHDSQASVGQGQEHLAYRAAHDGEVTRWTNSMFSGMPTYQIAPQYSSGDFLTNLSNAFGLGMTGAFSYVFALLLGFYILLRAFNFRPWLASLGAIVWAFSSYFFIIIAAGHIWKVMALAFIPPTIAGLVLCYRGRLLWGGAVTALFTALQILSNHVQMSYYFFFVMLFIVVAYGIDAARKHALPRFLKATGVIAVAGLLGVAANLPNLYHTYDYSKHTMRGGSELTPLPAKDGEVAATTAKGGLDYDYITQWSYGVDETLTLLIPDYKGGGTGPAITEENAYEEPQAQLLQYAQPVMQYVQTPPGFNQYWGNQPMTVGPVYVGAFIVFLFLLGLFVVRGPIKWALAGATFLSLLFAWGHNSPLLTHWFIDYLPMYNKFRTVSSALVIAEFTMPLLAVMALAEVLRRRDIWRDPYACVGLGVSATFTTGLCLVLWLAPGLAGDCLSASEAETMKALSTSGAFDASYVEGYTSAIASIRHGVLSASAGRSLLVILLCGGILALALSIRKFPAWVAGLGIGLICLTEMWMVNKKYLNDDSFTDPVARMDEFAKTPADEQILQDKDIDYRVLNLTVDPFNENTTSYWHKNVGGYHAAKLQRYQDLIERRIRPELSRLIDALNASQGNMAAISTDSICPVLNMLNTKYFILSKDYALPNPSANGNGWFVSRLSFVKGADAEMAALSGLDTKQAAVADEQFRGILDGSLLGQGTVKLTRYEANELHYDISSPQGGLVVFSEVFYPGWTATIDGQPAELGRVNYVLRALKMPKGTHKVVLEFRPTTITSTETVAYVSIALILLLFAGGLAIGLMRVFRGKGETVANNNEK